MALSVLGGADFYIGFLVCISIPMVALSVQGGLGVDHVPRVSPWASSLFNY